MTQWQPKTHSSCLFYSSSKTTHLSFTSKQNLPALYLCIRYIEVRMYFVICYLPILVWRFHSNPFRALIPTPSCTSMHPKWTGTQITSKNAKISTLDHYNFILAGYCHTKIWETIYICICIYIYYHLSKVCSDIAQPKKTSRFFMIQV